MNYKGKFIGNLVDYEPCQLLCPVTYQFVDFTPELKEHIDKIIKKEIK